MKYDCRVRIKNKIFKDGIEGELKGTGISSYDDNGNKVSRLLAVIKLDDGNRIFVDINDVEEIDDFPKEFIKVDGENSITISSNLDDWNKAIQKFKLDKNRDVIFVDTYNYSDDDDEIEHYFTSLSVPQAEFLVENLPKIIEYIKK